MSGETFTFEPKKTVEDVHNLKVRRRVQNLTIFMNDMKWSYEDALEAVCVWMAWEAWKSDYASQRGPTRAKGAFLNKIKSLYSKAYDKQLWDGEV